MRSQTPTYQWEGFYAHKITNRQANCEFPFV